MNERDDVDRSRESQSHGRGSKPTSRLLDRGRQVEHDAQSFVTGVEELISDVEKLLRERLDQRPYETLAFAAGAGFIVGGGLTVRMIATLVSIGGRMATAALMQGALTRVLSAVTDDGAEPASPGPSEHGP
jgi:hypothetical protein